ncbi:MAG: NUDIX hydrolase [Acidimicrobiia bacterium]|nr:NUDIX hydrolase [Acidimicrobiia bacterium]
MTRFRKLAEEPVYDGSLISVGRGTFQSVDGGQSFGRDLVHHPGAVCIVPVDDDRTVLMVRQYRAAIDADLLEIPAGKRDAEGEPPEETALRALQEEVGMHAGRVEERAEFYSSPGFSDEYSYVFRGLELTSVDASAHSPEEAAMEIERVALDEVPMLIRTGRLVDAKSIVGLCLAFEALKS